MSPFRSRLLSHQPQFGLFCVSSSFEVADALTDCGFDFLIFDNEHTPASLPTLHAQLLALAGTGTHAVVRVGANDPEVFKPVLDLGVETLMVPNVRSADEALAAVQGMRYAPEGVRGIGGSVRATRYGRRGDYYVRAAETLSLLVQVESVQGLMELERICGVPGVDGVFFGPADLAADMGFLGQPGHAEVVKACLEGVRRVRARGKAAGIVAPEARLEPFLQAGATLACFGSELAMLAGMMDALAGRWRRKTEV